MRNKAHKQKFASKHEIARRAGGNGGRVTEKKPVFSGARKSVPIGKGGNEAGTKERQQAAASAHRKLKAEALLADLKSSRPSQIAVAAENLDALVADLEGAVASCG